MNRFSLAVILAVLVVVPSMAEARSHRRHGCPCQVAAVATPQMTMAQPAVPQAVANNGQYQSFSYEPGTAAPATTVAPTTTVYYAPVTPHYVPPYLRPAYKAHGNYAP